jgi:hypothetical protein
MHVPPRPSTRNDEVTVSVANSIYHFDDDRLAKAFALNFKASMLRNKMISGDTAKKMIITGGELNALRGVMSRFAQAGTMVNRRGQQKFKDINVIVKSGELNLEFVKIPL